MSITGNLIESEFHRLFYSILCRAVVLAVILIGIVLSFSVGFQNKAQWYPGIYSLLKALGDIIVPGLCCAFFSAFFLGSDFEERTINHMCSSGYSRNAITLSKVLVYVISSTFIVALYPFARGAVTSVLCGWGAPFPNSFPLLFKAAVLCIIATVAGVSEFIIFAFLFRSVSGSMAAGILLTIARVVIKNVVCPSYPDFARLYYKTPMMIAYKIANSNLTKLTFYDCAETITISFVTILIVLFLCFWISNKMELK